MNKGATTDDCLQRANYKIGKARQWVRGDFSYKALNSLGDAQDAIDEARKKIAEHLRDKNVEMIDQMKGGEIDGFG